VRSVRRIEAIAARVAAATEGEWEMAQYQNGPLRVQCVASGDCVAVCDELDPTDNQGNCAFIAHACDDVPWLLARVVELKEALKQAQWAPMDYYGDSVCAGCDVYMDGKHPDSCYVAAALKAVQE
jgi:hypothetical protein